MEVISNTLDDEGISRKKVADEIATEPIRRGQKNASQMEESSVNISLR